MGGFILPEGRLQATPALPFDGLSADEQAQSTGQGVSTLADRNSRPLPGGFFIESAQCPMITTATCCAVLMRPS